MVWHLPHIRAIAAHAGAPVTLLAKPRSLADDLRVNDPVVGRYVMGSLIRAAGAGNMTGKWVPAPRADVARTGFRFGGGAASQRPACSRGLDGGNCGCGAAMGGDGNGGSSTRARSWRTM